MLRIFETETFLASLEQDFEEQKDKIKVKLRTQVYQQLKESLLSVSIYHQSGFC